MSKAENKNPIRILLEQDMVLSQQYLKETGNGIPLKRAHALDQKLQEFYDENNRGRIRRLLRNEKASKNSFKIPKEDIIVLNPGSQFSDAHSYSWNKILGGDGGFVSPIQGLTPLSSKDAGEIAYSFKKAFTYLKTRTQQLHTALKNIIF